MALGALVAAMLAPGMAMAQDATTLVAATANVAPALVAPAGVAPAPEAAPLFGPRLTQSRLAISAVAPAPALMMQAPARRRDVAWMVVGGAALVVGSIVGGDGGTIIMITGGVVGLMGLWRYLQYS
jgi:hypothetical protein